MPSSKTLAPPKQAGSHQVTGTKLGPSSHWHQTPTPSKSLPIKSLAPTSGAMAEVTSSSSSSKHVAPTPAASAGSGG